MLLKVDERLVLLDILPREGDFVTLRIIRDLRSALSFSEDEIAELEISATPDKRTQWRLDKDNGKEIEIGPKALEVIRSGFTVRDADSSLTLEHLATYERFMEAK